MPQTMTDEDLRKEIEAYEARLRAEMGVPSQEVTHFKRPVELPFTRSDRERVTVLFGGLTRTHDYVLRAAAEGRGYRVLDLPTPDNDSLSVGKEFCNRGQCNPTYYTVGNLVRYLQALRAAGEEEVEKRYVFLTAGACGPCRFGMYETEYRKALVDAGFPNFRVLIFQQTGGVADRGTLGEKAEEGGLGLDAGFYVAVLRGMIASDIVNTMAHKIRPYELEPGATDRVVAEAREILAESFRQSRSVWLALRRIRGLYNTIDVDYTRPKPKVQITGEFWAQTTEGDGSYRLQSWLESEGAEVITEPIGTWIDYILWSAVTKTRDRLGIRKGARKRLFALWVAICLYKSFYTFYRAALNYRTEPLVSQEELAERAADYYHFRLGGGEGHMEIGKHVMAVIHKKAHMVTSIKPFGCMPSTQSDGVQTKVVSKLKDSIFIPIETSGDGEVNVKSRVQMKLYEAKLRAREEVQRALEEHGVTLDDIHEHVRRHPKLMRPMQKLPHNYVGTAANFVAKVAGEMPQRKRSVATAPTPGEARSDV